jgi:cell division protein FtsQ
MQRSPSRLRVSSPGWRLLAAVVAVAVVAAGGWLALSASPLARAKRVYITGLSSPEEPRVRSALEQAARGMSTLRIREAVLSEAVAMYPSVERIEADGDFPHDVTIRVFERRPVAAIATGSTRMPVSGDGSLLTGMRADARLPVVRAPRGPRDPRVSSTVAMIAAAPRPLHRRVRRGWHDHRGLVLDLRQGPTLVFGDARRPRAKWAAAARVLAEPSAAGAVYLDVRVPERVAAGGVAGSSLDLDSMLSPDASPLAQVQPD